MVKLDQHCAEGLDHLSRKRYHSHMELASDEILYGEHQRRANISAFTYSFFLEEEDQNDLKQAAGILYELTDGHSGHPNYDLADRLYELATCVTLKHDLTNVRRIREAAGFADEEAQVSELAIRLNDLADQIETLPCLPSPFRSGPR